MIDGDGDEWLVAGVKDGGRFIHLFKAGSDGKIEKVLWLDTFEEHGPDPFKDYRIVGESLSDEQEAAIKEALKTKQKRKNVKT